MPPPQPVDFVPADFYIQVPHRDEMRQRGHFILRGEDRAHGPNGVREAEFFDLRKTIAQLEFPVAIHTWVGDSLIERYFRRPLRDVLVALAALLPPHLHSQYYGQHISLCVV